MVGSSGLRVSWLGLGTSTWGGDTDEVAAREILTGFVDSGGTLVDTSPAFSSGAAEEILGGILASGGIPREDLVISTDAGVNPELPLGRRVDCSRRALISGLDRSLATLGVDYIDLWSVGYWDENTPPAEVADACDYAVRTGRVRYCGVRGYAGWQLAVTHAEFGSARPVVAAQQEYNLLVRRPEEELLPAAQHLGVGFFAGAPLAQGVLTGKYRHGIPHASRAQSTDRHAEVQGYLDTRARTIVDALHTAATGLGITPGAAALAWVHDRPGVSSTIVGARHLGQLEEMLTTESIRLPGPITKALDDVSL